jgi:hypothetical protein
VGRSRREARDDSAGPRLGDRHGRRRGAARQRRDPAYRAVVGPGFVIKMGKPTKPGTIELVVADRTDAHNFHLTGPGVNVRTSVKAIRTYTFAVTLRTGTYRFVCNPHKTFMKGSFRIP